MTLSSKKQEKLTDDEWKEMTALRNAINDRPSAVHPDKMEEFTQYLVRSMREMGA
jgi:hypothetical protein